MDEDTLNLILSIQLDDLESFVSRRKGKAADGTPATNEELAVDFQKKELQNQRLKLADRRMTQSICRAVQDDGATITILADEERRSTQDREMACRLSGQPADVMLETPHSLINEETLSRFSSLNICQVEDDMSRDSESTVSFVRSETGESSSWAAGRKTVESRTQYECVACTELRVTLQVPCQHQYCRTCVVRLVSDATVDESLFPPRCCGKIMPISLIRPYIGADLAIKIEHKAIEFSAPYRTYCAFCGSFINLYDIEGSRGRCIACDANTCILCKQKYHNQDCPEDTAIEDVLRIAREEGWQRCLGCQTLVERREGCNHMV